MHDGWIWIEALWNASGMSRLLDRHGEELLATALVVLVALSLYRFVLQRARQHVDRNRGRALALRWRNALVAGVLMVLLLAWGSDLKSMAVSVAALGAALILALREVILCALGGLYRVLTSAYAVGDVIELNGQARMVGEVVDVDLLHTELIEHSDAGHTTTTRVRFPNALLLSASVRRRGQRGEYSVLVLRVPVAPSVTDLDLAEAALRAAAESVCAPFAAEAERGLDRMRHAELVHLPSHQLRVALVAEEPDRVALMLRYPCPAGGQAGIEREILLAYHRKLLNRKA
jgi:small-conductance mechanosensitive channel